MTETIIVASIVLWFLGEVTSNTFGGLIIILPVIASIAIIMKICK